jgi:hypothetical protein
MARILQLCFALLLVSSLAGCATPGQGTAENLTSIPQNRGLVLFSTSADKTNLSFSTVLTLVEGASLNKYDKVYINIDYPFSSNFPDEHAHVRTLALPQGEYFLLPSSGNPYLVMARAPVYKFKVSNDRIAYIGNFHLANNALRWEESKLKRDVDYFVRKNPGMANVPVEPQKAEIASDASRFRVNGIILRGP